MTGKQLNILAPTRYPWRFNGPRGSRHSISVRSFVPFNKISGKIEGVTVFNPWPFQKFDLIHAFNRIPIGTTPFVIGFESHLPRAFGLENTAFYRLLAETLAGPRCRKIIAISEYARRQFLRQHQGQPWAPALEKKLVVRYPNMPMPPAADGFQDSADKTIRLVFVGAHFARKGGLVALRMAEKAAQSGLALELDIVSSIEVGAASWVDPLRDEFFGPYRALLTSLPNVRHHGRLPNEEVLKLVGNAHFTLLPTFSDSFGFSAIESMANYTPVLATAQGALPEFIEDGVNGILLPLETDAVGEWAHIVHADRASTAYEALFEAETNRLAAAALERIEPLLADKTAYQALRTQARKTAETLFSAADANAFWDGIYEEAAS
ncbi:MAG: glycosyltransferase family 4 protein [Rhodospirillales bacterium]|nr:glycosyltransferase family 4 protein [Rhodospirillales bacterium]